MELDLDSLLKPLDQTKHLYKEVAMVVHRLASRCPECAFVLFGSRTKHSAHQYSDWDIGVYSDQLSYKKYLELLNLTDELTEKLCITIDLVNLTAADQNFIDINRDSFIFLAGNKSCWNIFLESFNGKS